MVVYMEFHLSNLDQKASKMLQNPQEDFLNFMVILSETCAVKKQLLSLLYCLKLLILSCLRSLIELCHANQFTKSYFFSFIFLFF